MENGDSGAQVNGGDLTTVEATSTISPSFSSSSSSSSYALSNTQQIILAVAPLPTALLSIVASLLIVQNVIKQNKKRNSYHRILLAMSLFDIIYSITLCLQMFLMPRETSPRITALGNDATCTASGFLLQFSFGTFLYNGVLSWHYLTTIVYGWKEPTGSSNRQSRWSSRRLVEPLLHGMTILFSLTTAFMGAIRGWFAEMDIGFGCWVNEYPRGCEIIDQSTGEMGPPCLSDDLGWIIGGIPISLIFFFVIFANLRIYCHVRSTILQSQRYAFAPGTSSTLSTLGGESVHTTTNSTNSTSITNQASTRRMRQVAMQGFMYVAAFWITGICNALVRIVEAYEMAETEADVYALLMVQAILAPSTGIFNMLVYYRPRYLRCRHNFPDETRFWALRRAIYGADVRPQSTLYSADPTRVGIASRLMAGMRSGVVSESAAVVSIDDSQETSAEVAAPPAAFGTRLCTTSKVVRWIASHDNAQEESDPVPENVQDEIDPVSPKHEQEESFRVERDSED